MKKITYSKAATKTLRKMPKPTATRIMAKVEQYATDPASLGNLVKALQGQQAMRLRVGDYRVIFNEDAHVIAVIKVAPRGGAY